MQNFPLRIGAPRYVLLAGGIGITALAEMARVLRLLGSDYRLVYAGRSRSRMAYADELAQAHGQRLRLHVSDESARLDTDALAAQAAEIPGTELYMCGPIRLMLAVRRSWHDRGLPAAALRYETFGNSGSFGEEEFVVRVPRLGVEATVGSGQSLLDALELAGVGVISDCLRGECGLCQVRVISVDGEIDHRDVFFSEEQRRRSPKMCACVSRAALADGRPGSRALLTIDVP